MLQQFDLLIIGGGPVGATLALSLAHLPLRIGLVEAKQTINDTRVLALTQVSKQIYSALGIWSKLASQATPIEHIHVSDRGHFGKTRFHARDAGVSALGYTIELQHLQAALHSPKMPYEFICPAQIESVLVQPQCVSVAIKTATGQQQLQTKLLIAADGADSFVRNALNIPTHKHDYQQHALVTKVHFSQPHQNTAYERFTDSGPLALLPLSEHQAALVWVGKAPQIAALQTCHEQEFIKQLQFTFGYTLGKFVAVEPRHAFPLQLVWAKEQVRTRVVILGNANHSLHPIAAQGFNLGLRDVAMLAQVLTDKTMGIGLNATMTKFNHDLGDLAILQQYAASRQQDQSFTIYSTNSLVRLFSNNLMPLAQVRSLGMLALDLCPGAKRLLTRRAMGFTRNMSWLSL
ncbi:2-octaprenyl-6-methoxyphenyl hydroxylase [soil metagenome]